MDAVQEGPLVPVPMEEDDVLLEVPLPADQKSALPVGRGWF